MTTDYMCPNCVTPWKCNGPHIPEETTTDDTRPLHTDPLMAERCDGHCASDECVCPDPTKSAAYQRLDARHAALAAAAQGVVDAWDMPEPQRLAVWRKREATLRAALASEEAG
jgi:hypothetical protein